MEWHLMWTQGPGEINSDKSKFLRSHQRAWSKEKWSGSIAITELMGAIMLALWLRVRGRSLSKTKDAVCICVIPAKELLIHDKSREFVCIRADKYSQELIRAYRMKQGHVDS